MAAENDLRTVAFPSISTGAFHFPKHEAAQVSSKAIKDFLAADQSIETVYLVFFSESDALKFIRHQKF